ncbi:uncharacterized mitochondrial protein AtMg00810-like [Miscanthus floridulus]|uniref:uncharacterized mitochondrial protein AtMg00810-like n=1 Tax=Miscanthus floridulus TaxID=154761 RepID=UPI0034590FD9
MGKEELVVGVYADDLIVTDACAEDIDSFKREMVAHFRMSNLGALSYYLVIEVRQEKEELTLDQSAYTSKLLERSGMAECKPCVTPMEERLKLTKASTAAKVDATLYQSIIDVDQRIVFPKTGGSRLQLTVFSNADMAGDIDRRRSTSGVLVFLGLALISWLSLKQKVVALSTCETVDCVDGGQIVIEFVETGRLLMDILTKPLGHLRLTELKEMIGMEGYKG